MKQKSTAFIFFLVISTFGFSQNLSLSVVPTQGGFDKTENISLEWTLGESFIETIKHQNEIYTQGFHQPFLINKLELHDFSFDFDIQISPNPVQSLINISITDTNNLQLIISLYDINGRFIKQISAFTNDRNIVLNVIELSSGFYILKISDIEGLFIKIHKIIKY